VRKILVVEPERLLCAAIVSLLSSEAGLYVIGFTPVTAAVLIEKIAQLHPDVVIIDQASRFIDAIRLVPRQHCAESCLLVVNLYDNWVDILHQQRVLMTRRADLITLIWRHPGQSSAEKSEQNAKDKISVYTKT
jgi:DNA-binding NarL/FixJ family response regulator